MKIPAAQSRPMVWWAIRGALLTLVLASAGCKRSPRTPTDYVRPEGPTAPWIIATPNPVPVVRGFGKTTINWWTGDGSPGQVYLSVNGGPERLFSSHHAHEDIRIGRGTYEFRLYAGTDHKTQLATTKVSLAKP